MSVVLIPFAQSSDGRIVAADEVNRGADCRCICVECHKPLLARRGEIRVPHFADESSGDGCTGGGKG